MRNRYTRLLFHPLHAIRRRIQILHDDQQLIDDILLVLVVGQILEDGLSIHELGPEELGTAEKQPVTTELASAATSSTVSSAREKEDR